MKHLAHTLAIISLVLVSMTCAAADDLAKLEGKWSVKKTSPDGQSFTQFLEIKKDKFTFTIVGAGNQVHLYAEGDLKLSKLGSFHVAKFANIKGGASASDVQPVDDDREVIYVLEDNSWTLASNFDKLRENQKPTADTYAKVSK